MRLSIGCTSVFLSDLAPPQKSGKWLLRGSAVE
jgi:hypothetical protein